MRLALLLVAATCCEAFVPLAGRASLRETIAAARRNSHPVRQAWKTCWVGRHTRGKTPSGAWKSHTGVGIVETATKSVSTSAVSQTEAAGLGASAAAPNSDEANLQLPSTPPTQASLELGLDNSITNSDTAVREGPISGSEFANVIAEKGYIVVKDFLPRNVVESLRLQSQALWDEGEFRQAAVGKDRAIVADVRGDSIRWMEQGMSAEWDQVCQILEDLRLAVNARMYLGLAEHEFHFARYPAGGRYTRHFDQIKGSNGKRQLTITLYLNDENWEPEHRGHLRLYPDASDDAVVHDVLPAGGTMVAFLSEGIAHEVLPHCRPEAHRLSLTGWFLRR